ncbi:hypothetical protein BJY01DRAFT_251709 [Aspergillus pseudoustus]|uniref:BZIP domain-containing protein n=1 Tax=Aspergillus pseudoustus TaxID=1810923 RepID=A0ABR4JB00_9EURO
MATMNDYCFVNYIPSQFTESQMDLHESTSRQGSRPREAKQPTSRRSVEKNERRRQQVRVAQRAYRARSEAYTRRLEQRVARLEAALERAGRAVIAFADNVIETQILISHQQLVHQLRDTVKTCLESALVGEDDCHEQTRDPKRGDVSGTSPTLRGTEQVDDDSQHAERPRAAVDQETPPLGILPCSPPLSLDTTMIEVPAFAQQLRIACLYQGFLMLNNPSVPLEALRRPFCLLLSLVPRETIASFFQMCLHARLQNQEPYRWLDIPCFALGGAGTHFPSATTTPVSDEMQSRQQRGGSPASPHQEPPSAIDAAPSAFSPESRKDLDGEWFDLLDLVGYLGEQDVVLSMERPTLGTAHRVINVVNFTAALIEKGICLGHSPGFKRSDVEMAIESSAWK